MVGDVGSFEGGEIELGGMWVYLQSVNIKGDCLNGAYIVKSLT